MTAHGASIENVRGHRPRLQRSPTCRSGRGHVHHHRNFHRHRSFPVASWMRVRAKVPERTPAAEAPGCFASPDAVPELPDEVRELVVAGEDSHELALEQEPDWAGSQGPAAAGS